MAVEDQQALPRDCVLFILDVCLGLPCPLNVPVLVLVEPRQVMRSKSFFGCRLLCPQCILAVKIHPSVHLPNLRRPCSHTHFCRSRIFSSWSVLTVAVVELSVERKKKIDFCSSHLPPQTCMYYLVMSLMVVKTLLGWMLGVRSAGHRKFLICVWSSSVKNPLYRL